MLWRNCSPCTRGNNWRQVKSLWWFPWSLDQVLNILSSTTALGDTTTVPSFHMQKVRSKSLLQNDSSPASTVLFLLCLESWQRNSSSSLTTSVLFHVIPHKTKVLTPKDRLLVLNIWINYWNLHIPETVWGKSLEFLHQFLYLWRVVRSILYRQSSPLWDNTCYISL